MARSQTIDIPFVGQLREDVDPRLMPQGLFSVLHNVWEPKQGAITRRVGFERSTFASSPTQRKALRAYGDGASQVIVADGGGVWEEHDGYFREQQILGLAGATSFDAVRLPIMSATDVRPALRLGDVGSPNNTEVRQVQTVCSSNGVVLVASVISYGVDWALRLDWRGHDNNAPLRAPVILVSGCSKIDIRLTATSTAAYLFVYRSDTALIEFYNLQFSTFGMDTNPGYTVGPVTILTPASTTNLYWDARASTEAGEIYFAITYQGRGNIGVYKLNTLGIPTASRNISSPYAETDFAQLAVFPDRELTANGGRVWVAYNAYNGATYSRSVWTGDKSTMGAGSYAGIDTGLISVADVAIGPAVEWSTSATNSYCLAVFSQRTNLTGSAGLYFLSSKAVVASWNGSSVGVGESMYWPFCYPVSHVFRADSRNIASSVTGKTIVDSCLWMRRSRIFGATSYDDMTDSEGLSLVRFRAVEVAAEVGYVPSLDNAKLWLEASAEVGTARDVPSHGWSPLGEVTSDASGWSVFSAATRVGGTSVSGFTTGADFLRNECGSLYRSPGVSWGGTWCIAGGVLAAYAAGTASEIGCTWVPGIVYMSSTPSASKVDVGDHFYTYIWEWTDGAGNVHRSAPAIPQSITLAVSSTVSVECVRPCHSYMQGGTYAYRIRLYRTVAGGTVYYETAVADAPVVAGTAGTLVVTDSTQDSALVSNAVLYTTGGAVESFPPSGGTHLCVHKDRLAVCHQDRVYVSHEWTPGEGAVLNRDLMSEVVPRPIAAVASMDDALVAFGSSGWIGALHGEGPDRLGQGAYTVQRIPAESGPADWRSVVECKQGIAYLGAGAVYVLPRGLGSPERVGSALEESIASYPRCSGAIRIPSRSWVVFGLENDTGTIPEATAQGGMLGIWDEESGKWYRWAFGRDQISGGGGAFSDLSAWCVLESGEMGFHDRVTGIRYTWDGANSTFADDGSSDYAYARIRLGWVDPVGGVGEFRLRSVTAWGECLEVTSPTLTVDITRAGSDVTETSESATGTAGTAADAWRWTHYPSKQLGGAVQLTYDISGQRAASSLNGISLEVQPMRGPQRLSSARRT